MHEAAAAASEQAPGPHGSNKHQQPPRSASGMKRAAAIRRLQSCAFAERCSHNTHTPHGSRGAFYLPGPSQSIARGSWSATDPHAIHEQRHMSVDRRFKPFFLDLLGRFQPFFFNTVLQSFLWQQGLNLIPPGSEPGLVGLKSKSTARSSGWLFPGRKGKIHFASALLCDKKDICPKELLLTCLASGNSSFSD